MSPCQPARVGNSSDPRINEEQNGLAIRCCHQRMQGLNYHRTAVEERRPQAGHRNASKGEKAGGFIPPEQRRELHHHVAAGAYRYPIYTLVQEERDPHLLPPPERPEEARISALAGGKEGNLTTLPFAALNCSRGRG